MVKYSAKKRTGSKKQSFKKRKYNKKKGGGGGDVDAPDAPNADDDTTTGDGAPNSAPNSADDTTTGNAENTTADAPAAPTAADATTDDTNHLKKFYDDLIKRILGQINNICDEKDEGKRKEMLENAIMNKE